jgi:hypothetical protein
VERSATLGYSAKKIASETDQQVLGIKCDVTEEALSGGPGRVRLVPEK